MNVNGQTLARRVLALAVEAKHPELDAMRPDLQAALQALEQGEYLPAALALGRLYRARLGVILSNALLSAGLSAAYEGLSQQVREAAEREMPGYVEGFDDHAGFYAIWRNHFAHGGDHSEALALLLQRRLHA